MEIFNPGQISRYYDGIKEFYSKEGFPYEVVFCDTMEEAIVYYHEECPNSSCFTLGDSYDLIVLDETPEGLFRNFL